MKKIVRILKIVVIVIALAVGAGYIFGSVAGDVEYTSSVEIEAPQGFSWSVFQDPTHMRTWLQGFQRIEMLDGDIGKPGSQYNIVLLEHGKEIQVVQTLLEMRPPKEMIYALENDHLMGRTEIVFETLNQKTTITAKTVSHGRGGFQNLLVHLGKGHIANGDQENWNRLKQLIEAKYARK